MTLRSTLARGVLVKRATADGLVEVQDHISLGRVYQVDLASVQRVKLWHIDRRCYHEREVVDVVFPNGDREWFPTELLRIES